MTKYSIINKINIFQNNLTNKHKTHSIQRRLQYQKFISNPDRHLPSIEALRRWRNRLALLSMMVLFIPVLEILLLGPGYIDVCDWDPYYDFINNIPGAVFIILVMFSGLFDYAIYKRSGGSISTFIDHQD